MKKGRIEGIASFLSIEFTDPPEKMEFHRDIEAEKHEAIASARANSHRLSRLQNAKEL